MGGFGVVFEATDNELGRSVAIKVLHRQHGWSIDEDLLAEARTVAKLDHPNIVPVFDILRTEELIVVVSKLISGKNLSEVRGSSKVQVKAAVEIVSRIALALHHAHLSGIIHRDVKPSNILVSKKGVFLCDFGLAVLGDDSNIAEAVAGTMAYMSPEQARGDSNFVDGRSDIYSLGVVLYELLTGRRPFVGDPVTLLRRISSQEVPPPRQIRDSIPREVEEICLKALALRPAERYSTAKDFADDLMNWLTETAVQNEVEVLEIPQPSDFVAQFHPLGALSSVFLVLGEHWRFGGILLLPILYSLKELLSQSSRGFRIDSWIIYLVLSSPVVPMIAAALKYLNSSLELRGGKLIMSKGYIDKITVEIPIDDLTTIQVFQDSLGRKSGYGSIRISALHNYETIDGVRDPHSIERNFAPFLKVMKELKRA